MSKPTKPKREPSEAQRIRTAVAAFSHEMREKLLFKASAAGGTWWGWDSEQFRDRFVELLLMHVAKATRDDKQWIDVANFALFLWWTSNAEAEKRFPTPKRKRAAKGK